MGMLRLRDPLVIRARQLATAQSPSIPLLGVLASPQAWAAPVLRPSGRAGGAFARHSLAPSAARDPPTTRYPSRCDTVTCGGAIMRMHTLPVQGNQGRVSGAQEPRECHVTSPRADVPTMPTARGGASACFGRRDPLCSRDRRPSRVTQWIPRCVVPTAFTRQAIAEKETAHVR